METEAHARREGQASLSEVLFEKESPKARLEGKQRANHTSKPRAKLGRRRPQRAAECAAAREPALANSAFVCPRGCGSRTMEGVPNLHQRSGCSESVRVPLCSGWAGQDQGPTGAPTSPGPGESAGRRPHLESARRGGSPPGAPAHLRPPPRPLALLTVVQGVPASLGRRHQLQIQSPQSHRYHGEQQQQPEAPPQQLDRAQEQHQQRGARAPHGASPGRPPQHGPPTRRPGPPPPLSAAHNQSPRLVLQPAARSCSARWGDPRLRGCLAGLSPAAEPGSSSPSVRSTPLLVAGPPPPSLFSFSLLHAAQEALLVARRPLRVLTAVRELSAPSTTLHPTCPAHVLAPPPGAGGPRPLEVEGRGEVGPESWSPT